MLDIRLTSKHEHALRSLDRLTDLDRRQAGNKAANLARLLALGLRVPPGFVILVGAQEMPQDELWAQVNAAYRRLLAVNFPAGGSKLVAVRSSGQEEDGARASYAGQFRSVLGVGDEAALQEAIQSCWESAGAAGVQSYRVARGENERSGLPVLVQRQVDARLSGVLFTRDPLSGESATLIEVAPGLGEALLSGRVSPERWRLAKHGGALEAPPGVPLLTSENLAQLYKLGQEVEAWLKTGVDIEWALDGQGTLWVLQARPITGPGRGLQNANKMPLDKVWTRANVGEVLPQPVTTLTWEVFHRLLTGATGGEPAGLKNQPSEGLRRMNGRVYLRLDGLLDSFCYLPGVTPNVMRQVLGVEIPPGATPYARPSGWKVRLAQALFWLDALGWLPRLKMLEHGLGEIPEPPEPLEKLMVWTQRAFRAHLRASGYAFAAFAWLSRLSPEAARLASGSSDLQTAQQGRELQALAGRLVQTQPLSAALQAGVNWNELQALAEENGCEAFLRDFERFLRKNGARAAGELELATPRWREEPRFLLDILRQQLNAGEMVAFKKPSGAFPGGSGLSLPQRFLLSRLQKAYARYTTQRENLKYRLMEGFAALREHFLVEGRKLKAGGKLCHADDVFFLGLAEIHPSSGLQLESMADRAAQRKGEWQMWNIRPVPDIWVEGRPFLSPEPGFSGSIGSELQGIGACPGQITGRARVLREPGEAAQLLPGEILVAPHTDPGWTPLFLTCAGVVTEIGGFLSHGATVAREYGIPCVVNAKGAAEMIRTGDRIRVDGARGTVVLLEPYR